MKYIRDLFGIRLNIFANVLGCIGAFYSIAMFTIYVISFVRKVDLCSPLNIFCILSPEEQPVLDRHFVLEFVYYAVWFISSMSLLIGNHIKNDLLFLPWLYVVICDMILLMISLTHSIINLVKLFAIAEGNNLNRILLVQFHCMIMKIVLNIIFLALMAYIWQGMFSLYMKLPYKEININSSCSRDLPQEDINEDYVVYTLP